MEKYAIDKVIGEGTYGIVFRAVEKSSGDVVAIKKFKSVSDEQLSKREIQAISMLSHAYIVSYRHSFRHEGLLHLVFDYVPDSINKLLSRNRRGIKPIQAQRIVYQLCQALQYCHASRVIHRDVKPDNILLDENGDIRLCDFGVARAIQFEGDPLSDYVATRWYRPPEQELRMDRYSFDADIWSVGCVLVELLTGRPLFPGNTQIDQLNMIQEYLGPLPTCMMSRLPRGVSVVKKPSKSLEELFKTRELPDGTLEFITHTLQLEPKNRLSAAECLSHRFLKPLREAEQRERKTRQHEEKKQRSQHLSVSGSPDSEDGIEEEIPESRMMAEAKSPVGTPIYRSRSVEKRSQQRENKAPSKLRGENNPAEGDNDDIQEIIEMDDMCLAEPTSPRGAKRSSHEEEKRSPSKSTKPVRRRRISDHELRGGDPVEPAHNHECYEDDFED